MTDLNNELAQPAELVTLFENLCKFTNLAPLNALAILSTHKWEDDNDFSDVANHIKVGF